jgi:hypothetical protein
MDGKWKWKDVSNTLPPGVAEILAEAGFDCYLALANAKKEDIESLH